MRAEFEHVFGRVADLCASGFAQAASTISCIAEMQLEMRSGRTGSIWFTTAFNAIKKSGNFCGSFSINVTMLMKHSENDSLLPSAPPPPFKTGNLLSKMRISEPAVRSNMLAAVLCEKCEKCSRIALVDSLSSQRAGHLKKRRQQASVRHR